MDNINTILTVIRGIALLNTNPALGGGGAKREEITEFLRMTADLIQGGSEMRNALEAFAEEIQQMAAEGRNPSVGHWDAMRARHETARGLIAANARRLQEEEDSLGVVDSPIPTSDERLELLKQRVEIRGLESGQLLVIDSQTGEPIREEPFTSKEEVDAFLQEIANNLTS